MKNIRSHSRAFAALTRRPPAAFAEITGSDEYPDIYGTVLLYPTSLGVLVTADVSGLPQEEGKCTGEIFGFHIHTGESCTGNASDPFADTLAHYNPGECEHPRHAGDMPPLFGNNGYAFMSFLTDRFTIKDVLGKTVVIHRMPDDFTTQPSGNSGVKIACGKIEKAR